MTDQLHENEIVMLLICVVALVFAAIYHKFIKQVEGYKILYSSFGFFFIASISTNLETIYMEQYLNILEHISYLLTVIVLFWWTYKYLLVRR